MNSTDHDTSELPIIDARGPRGLVEQIIFGPTEKPTQNDHWHQRVPGPQLPGAVSATTLLLGAWLVLTPFLFDRGTGWFAADWNDVLVGIGIFAVGVIRLTSAPRLITVTAVGTAFGAWMAMAPLVFAGSTAAAIADVLVGLAVAGATVVGFVDAGRNTDAADPGQPRGSA